MKVYIRMRFMLTPGGPVWYVLSIQDPRHINFRLTR